MDFRDSCSSEGCGRTPGPINGSRFLTLERSEYLLKGSVLAKQTREFSEGSDHFHVIYLIST
jgi:hypothetical protein